MNDLMNDAREEIVITGAGLATCLGLTRQTTWEGILQHRSGMGPLRAMESPLAPGKDGGQAPDLPDTFQPEKPREVRYLEWTIGAALSDAGLNGALAHPPFRCACLLGTTLHGMRAAGRFLRSGDFSALRAFPAGNTLQSAISDFGLQGLAATTCSACSSSLGSIALAVTLLESHQVDLVIAGGYDTISEYVYGGFNSLRLVAEGPLRPFAKNRQGMKLAEGYGIVVLERAGDANRRGANVLATILGWGESADAHHLTQPHPQGDGAARAMSSAIARADLTAADIDLVAAHATGTPDNDSSEYAALQRIFAEHLPKLPVVAFKSHLGHTLGGAGAVELILSAMALKEQIIPTCANVTAQDVEFPNLLLATGAPRSAPLRTTLNTSLGFGGANTCIILGKAPTPASAQSSIEVSSSKPEAARSASRDVFITGIGVLLPGIIGNDAFLARLSSDAPPAWQLDPATIEEGTAEGLLNARRVRRMSDYVKYTLASATLACRDANITDTAAFAETCAAVLGSAHGSANYSETYYAQIVKEGLIAANPMLFAEAVPNAGAAQLSLMLALKGACQTVIGTRTAGLDALALAAARIRNGDWHRAIVSAGEEYCPLVRQTYNACGQAASARGNAPFGESIGFVPGAGAVTFILESADSMRARDGKPRGRILASAAGRADRSSIANAAADILEQLDRPANVLSSACGTWIDRAELAAMRHAQVKIASTIYGHVAETFSATPLAAIAAVLLSGKLPALRGSAWPDANEQPLAPARGDQRAETFAALCTDFNGGVSAVSLATSSDSRTLVA